MISDPQRNRSGDPGERNMGVGKADSRVGFSVGTPLWTMGVLPLQDSGESGKMCFRIVYMKDRRECTYRLHHPLVRASPGILMHLHFQATPTGIPSKKSLGRK